MLRWAIAFAIISLIAGFFGFYGLSADAAGIAKFLALFFLVLFVIALLIGGKVFNSVTSQ